jgi:hypothetical protein
MKRSSRSQFQERLSASCELELTLPQLPPHGGGVGVGTIGAREGQLLPRRRGGHTPEDAIHYSGQECTGWRARNKERAFSWQVRDDVPLQHAEAGEMKDARDFACGARVAEGPTTRFGSKSGVIGIRLTATSTTLPREMESGPEQGAKNSWKKLCRRGRR